MGEYADDAIDQSLAFILDREFSSEFDTDDDYSPRYPSRYRSRRPRQPRLMDRYVEETQALADKRWWEGLITHEIGWRLVGYTLRAEALFENKYGRTVTLRGEDALAIKYAIERARNESVYEGIADQIGQDRSYDGV